MGSHFNAGPRPAQDELSARRLSGPSGAIQFVPTVERILYGVGTAEQQLGPELERLNCKRVLLLTPRSLESHEVVARTRKTLAKRLAESFTAAFEHVPLQTAVEAAAVARRCRADSVVALGGGSVIDTAKAVRTCLAENITSAEMLGAFMERAQPLSAKLIPQLTIPTTLSGAEYTRSFSCTDFTTGFKRSYTDSAVASRSIIYDPVVTLPTPLPLWLASGVMALDHAIEVFCCSLPHVIGDRLKFFSIVELFTYLPQVRQEPSDLQARLRCQVGSWLADHSPLRAQDLSGRRAALPSHALAYELGAVCRVPYAMTACVTLPACMRWAAARSPLSATRQAQLARALKVAERQAPKRTAAQLFERHVRKFIEDLGLPTKLRSVGVGDDDMERVARHFVEQGRWLTTNAAATEDDVLSLLRSAS
jgi:alcohol dehydrogenase class IV